MTRGEGFAVFHPTLQSPLALHAVCDASYQSAQFSRVSQVGSPHPFTDSFRKRGRSGSLAHRASRANPGMQDSTVGAVIPFGGTSVSNAVDDVGKAVRCQVWLDSPRVEDGVRVTL